MYTLKTKDIPKNFACIYKINFPNGKIYVGRTTNLKRRAYEHNNTNKARAVCDFAIAKYGKITEWEILQDNFDEMDIYESEKFWIEKLNSQDKKIGYNISPGGKDSESSGENSSRSVFTNAEVLDIRKRRYNREKKLDVYKDYNDRNFKSFGKVWEGKGYSEVGKEYLTTFQYGLYSGEENASTNLKEEQVFDIRRLYYEEEKTQGEIGKKYSFIPKTTLNNIIQFNSWKYVATEYKGNHRYHGKKKVTTEIARQVKEDIVYGYTIKELKEKYSKYNLKQIVKIAQGNLFSEIIVEKFTPVIGSKKYDQEEKDKIWEEFLKKDSNQTIKEFCQQMKISKSSFYRIQKQKQK